MSSITARIKEVEQPYGGYLKTSSFTIKKLQGDGVMQSENITPVLVNTTVRYLSRALVTGNKRMAFAQLLRGAEKCEKLDTAKELMSHIKGLDTESVIFMCRLASFDVWITSPASAQFTKPISCINPDNNTVQNIKTLVRRTLMFMDEYGPIMVFDGKYQPDSYDREEYFNLLYGKSNNFGGYTATVNSGSNDFCTKDTIWNYHISWVRASSKQTLKILMNYIMAKDSGQKEYKDINNLGIYNPRLNMIWTCPVSSIPKETIQKVREEVLVCKTGKT